MMLIAVSALVLTGMALIFIALSWFFWLEMRKKFGMHYERLMKVKHAVFYPMTNSWDDYGREPHMRNIAVRSIDGSKFTLTVYIQIGKDLADPFIVVESDESGLAVYKTYSGHNYATIIFEPTPDIEIAVSSTEEDQDLVSTGIAVPHWFQTFEPVAKLVAWTSRKV